MAQNNFFENEKYEQNIKNNKHQDVINYVGNPGRNEKGKYTELNFKKEDLEQALYSLKKDVPKIAEAFPNGFNNETLFVMKHQLDAYYNGLSDMTPQEVFSAKNILSLQNKPTVKALAEFAETKKFKTSLETLKITDENGQKTSEKRIGENVKDTDPDNLINLHKLGLVQLNEKGQQLKMKDEKNLISDASATAFQSEQKKVSKDIENALKEFGIKTPAKEKTSNRKPEDEIAKGNTVNQKENGSFHEKFVTLKNEAYANLKMRVASLSNTSSYTNVESSKGSATLSNNGDGDLLNQVAEKINTVENKINAAENGMNNSGGVQSNVQETGQTQSDTSATVTENSESTNSSSSNSKKNSNSKNKDKGSKGNDTKDSKDKSSKDKTKDNKDKKNSSSETKQNNKSSENKSQKDKKSSKENSIQKDNAEKGNNKETQNSKAQDVKPVPVSQGQGPQPQATSQNLSEGLRALEDEKRWQKKLDASKTEKERLEKKLVELEKARSKEASKDTTGYYKGKVPSKAVMDIDSEIKTIRDRSKQEDYNMEDYREARNYSKGMREKYMTNSENKTEYNKHMLEVNRLSNKERNIKDQITALENNDNMSQSKKIDAKNTKQSELEKTQKAKKHAQDKAKEFSR